MNKQEGNKIIAGFMGATPNDRTLSGRTTTFWEGGDVPSLMLGASPSTKELRFHSDWRWLMPVVKKIDQLDGITSYVEGYYKSWGTSYSNVISGHYVNEMDIGDVWEGCVEFIKWYNENEV